MLFAEDFLQLLWFLRAVYIGAAVNRSVYHNRHFRGNSMLGEFTRNRNGINAIFHLFLSFFSFLYSHIQSHVANIYYQVQKRLKETKILAEMAKIYKLKAWQKSA